MDWLLVWPLGLNYDKKKTVLLVYLYLFVKKKSLIVLRLSNYQLFLALLSCISFLYSTGLKKKQILQKGMLICLCLVGRFNLYPVYLTSIVINVDMLCLVGRFNLYPVYLTSIVIVLIILIVASLCFIFSHR